MFKGEWLESSRSHVWVAVWEVCVPRGAPLEACWPDSDWAFSDHLAGAAQVT